jgi:hypothetical protein
VNPCDAGYGPVMGSCENSNGTWGLINGGEFLGNFTEFSIEKRGRNIPPPQADSMKYIGVLKVSGNLCDLVRVV